MPECPLNILKYFEKPSIAHLIREYGLVLPTIYHTVQDSTGSGGMNESVFSVATPYQWA